MHGLTWIRTFSVFLPLLCCGQDTAITGALLAGSVSSVQGKGPVSLGSPPYDPSQDWAVLVTHR
jgi:hypothetical protein